MSYSLDFCKKRAANPDLSKYADRNWEKAVELDYTERSFDSKIHGERNYELTGRDSEGNELKINVNLHFDPDGKSGFDYFTSASCIDDGTMLYIWELMDKIIENVLSLRTYNVSQGPPVDGSTVTWMIGNFIILTEYDGDWDRPENKPWLNRRVTILLPLKYTVK